VARTLWCRDCGIGYASLAGDVPIQCPRCEASPARWSTVAPAESSGTIYPADPKRAYRLTDNDRRFLKSIRVSQDEG